MLKGYKIDLVNALTGEVIDTTEKISDSFGHLKLEFPGTLTGNATCPILFFKLYRSDATFLTPVAPNEFESALPNEYKKDEGLNAIPITEWHDSTDVIKNESFLVTVSPNPTAGQVNISISGANEAPLNWVLTDLNGKVMMSKNVITTNFIIDLSVYSNGTYYLVIKEDAGAIKQTLKIVKQ